MVKQGICKYCGEPALKETSVRCAKCIKEKQNEYHNSIRQRTNDFTTLPANFVLEVLDWTKIKPNEEVPSTVPLVNTYDRVQGMVDRRLAKKAKRMSRRRLNHKIGRPATHFRIIYYPEVKSYKVEKTGKILSVAMFDWLIKNFTLDRTYQYAGTQVKHYSKNKQTIIVYEGGRLIRGNSTNRN